MKNNLFLLALLCVSANALCMEGEDNTNGSPKVVRRKAISASKMQLPEWANKNNAATVVTLGALVFGAYKLPEKSIPLIAAAAGFGLVKANNAVNKDVDSYGFDRKNPWITGAAAAGLSLAGQKAFFAFKNSDVSLFRR